MPEYKPRKSVDTEPALKMTSEDWAYLAGIVDGEGFISFVPRGVSSKGLIKMRAAAVGVSTSSRDLLNWLRGKIGGTFSMLRPRDHTNSKYIYNWRITNYRAVVLARSIRPYLKIKGRQAELLIEHYEIRMRSRDERTMIRDELGVRYMPEVVLALDKIHNEIFDLNARGRLVKKSLAKRYVCNGVVVEVGE